MTQTSRTAEFIQNQCARYPGLALQDLFKALYQSAFGCGHFLADEAAGLELLRREAAACTPFPGAAVEELDGSYCRIHLQYLQEHSLSPETFFRLFVRSAQASDGDQTALTERLVCLTAMAEAGQIPFSPAETAHAIADWAEAGYPPLHHSPQFRSAFAPAYRVLRREFLPLLPLLAEIDRLTAERPRVLVALEGGSASGKTTLASLLEAIYDCNVFHMDDFFLRPEQRTQARFAEPGGNVDRERFWDEVLSPLTRNEAVRSRRYDCQTQTLQPPVEIPPKALNIVEGAYSMHPALADAYDLSAFLAISPGAQAARIRRRNTPEQQAMFFSRWIPLESAYFAALDVPERCDLILNVES